MVATDENADPAVNPAPSPRRTWAIVLAGVAAFLAFVALRTATRGSDPAATARDAQVVEVAPPSTREPAPEIAPTPASAPERRFPHDVDAFTQGLLIHPDGRVFESTGLNGRSSIRQVTLETGEVSRRQAVAREYFAEGLARVDDRLIQLTWQRGVALEYDLETFQLRREFHYSGQGWGLCLDTHEGARRLVMSDGSETLTFRDPDTFERTGSVRVMRGRRPQRSLNELECVNGAIYANVWQTDEIVRIEPESGRVTAIIDASGLLTERERDDTDVLNGIAYLPESGHFVITGKLWPTMFEVAFE